VWFRRLPLFASLVQIMFDNENAFDASPVS